jgi:hypothetical protein
MPDESLAPNIRGLAIRHLPWLGQWLAQGTVEGVELEAYGTSLMGAWEQLEDQVRALLAKPEEGQHT